MLYYKMYSNEVLNERKGLFNPDCIHLSLKGTSVMTQTLYPPLTPTTSPLISGFRFVDCVSHLTKVTGGLKMYSNEVLNERKGLFNPDCIHLSLKGTSVMTQTLYPPLTPTTSPLITRF